MSGLGQLRRWTIVLSGVAACGDSRPEATAVVRDSAGISIVENTEPANEPPLPIPDSPTLDIGVSEGPEPLQLDGVSGSARLSDGTIAVMNGGSQEVRLFGPDGGFQRSFGGEGSGPGEFRRARLAGRLGDTLVVFDAGTQRLSRLHPEGGVLSEDRVPTEGLLFPIPAGVLSDGRVLLHEGISFRPGAGDGVARNPVPYALAPPGGASLDTLGEFPGPAMFHRGPRASRMPFAAETRAAVGADRIYVATNEAPEIRVLDSSGSLVALIRTGATTESVSPEALRRWIEEQVAAVPPELQTDTRRSYEEMPSPATYPPFERLLVDGEGRLWAQDYRRPGEGPGLWTVFDREGRRLARVRAPARLRVHEIGPDYVLGAWRDDLDVQHVRLYPLRPIRGTPNS